MQVKNQIVDQTLKLTELSQAANRAGGAGQEQGRDGKDFDTMVRQKQQQAKPQGSKDAKAARKVPGQKEARENGQEPMGEEQYAMAAALLMQVQPEIQYVEAAPEEISAEIPAEAVEAGGPAEVLAAPEQQQTAQGFEAEADVETAAPAETAAPIRREAPVQRSEEAEARPERIVREDGPVREAVRLTEAPREEEDEDIPAETVQLEVPVFGQVEAAPVRVAAPEPTEEPVRLEAEDAPRQLAGRIERLVTDETGASRVELTLSPESLGKITVEITHSADGALRVQLGATTVRAASLLERHSGGLQNLLMSDTRPRVEVQVRAGSEAQQQFLNPNGQNNSQQQQQQQQSRQQEEQSRRPEERPQDFLQQLRLGLVDLPER